MLHLVIINGYGGAGKDTFVEMCRNYATENNLSVPVYNTHHSDLAKIALKVMGWNGEKDFSSREVLKKLTSYGDRTGKTMTHITAMLEMLASDMGDEDKAIIFYHAREHAFIESLTERAERMRIPTTRLLIKREGKNEEPLAWYDIKDEYFDVIVHNNDSLDTLRVSAEKFMRMVLDGGENDGEE